MRTALNALLFTPHSAIESSCRLHDSNSSLLCQAVCIHYSDPN